MPHRLQSRLPRDMRSSFYSLMSSEKIFSLGGGIEKLSPSGSAFSVLLDVIKKLDCLQDIFRLVIDEFSDFSKSIGCIHFIIREVAFALEELKRKLAQSEAQLPAL